MDRTKLKAMGFTFDHADRSWKFQPVILKDSVVEAIPEQMVEDILLTTLDDALNSTKLRVRMKKIGPVLGLLPTVRESVRISVNGLQEHAGGCPGCDRGPA